MKKCVYCAQDIPDLARKCPLCHSFQTTSDEPKKPIELATLVISFVGSVAAVATITAGTFAYFGFQSIADVNKRTGTILEQSTTILKDAQERMTRLSLAEQAFNNTKFGHSASLTIRQAYDRYDKLMDSLSIDELYKTGSLLNDLKEVSDTASHVGEMRDDSAIRSMKMEIISVISGVIAYNDGKFDEAANAIASTVPETSLHKHLLMAAAYIRLYDLALQHNNPQMAESYINLGKLQAESALEVAKKANRGVGSAEINLAAALMFRDQPGDLDSAYKYLVDAKNLPATVGDCIQYSGYIR